MNNNNILMKKNLKRMGKYKKNKRWMEVNNENEI